MSVFAENEIRSIDGVNLEGKLVIMKPEHLVKGAQDKKYQVNYAYYGSGCYPDLSVSGKKVYVYDLSTGEDCVYHRSNFIGYIEEIQLSPEQKAMLVKVKNR